MKFPKNSKWGILGILIIIIFLSISMVFAHQPRLVSDNSTISNPIVVKNPEISQAFYGQLNGNPAYYKIQSNETFRLYVNILVPDVPGSSSKLMSVQITDSSGKTLALLDAKNSTWTPYFEEFGGDNYLKGPEFNQTEPAGTYYIKVFNDNNQGKYSLAIGDIESFPPGETLVTLFLLPLIKADIFQVPVAELFIQFLGLILAIGTFLVLYTLMIRSRKSNATLEVTKTVYGAVNPIMLIGVAITAVMWFLTYFKDTFNILGIIETLLLVIILLMHLNLNSKLKKLSSDKIPTKLSTILLLLWILFLFLRIVLIQS
jgi:hypothetical protein